MTRDFSRAGKAARRKGAKGELEVRDILREFGYADVRRNWMSGGAGGSDLIEAIPDVAIEVKRTESTPFAVWWRQANKAAKSSDMVLIVHRGHSQPWQATGLLTDLHMMMQHLPMWPVIASSNPRAVFMLQHKVLTVSRRPMVLHRVLGEVLATVLFEDWLAVTAPVRPEELAA